MQNRERLGSRLGFIMLSAGCAIGCGNVWKFPWMCGQNGGGSFMLLYIICLVVLGLPAMTMEFSVGRAAQASPIRMYQKLEKPGCKWGIFGIASLIGNIALMAFYTVVTGWIIYYFIKFLTGQNADFGFTQMITNPTVNVVFLLVTVVVAFAILSFNLQGGLERITKYMMLALLVLMLVLAVHSLPLPGAAEGLKFYLVPDFGKIDGSVVVGAMNQAFFTLSVGMGGMAIFGSYIEKEHSLMGESVHIIVLDTLVAVLAGIIMFPACFTYGLEVNAGPSLLFDTMATVFNNMTGGRFGNILDTIRSRMNSARDAVSNAINQIKGFFNFSWSLPHLAMPQPRVSGSFSLNPPSVPSFSIDWYATGGIMKNPTAFGVNGSRLMVGGEAGAEAILPLAPFYAQLEQMLDDKVTAALKAMRVVVYVENKLDGDDLTAKVTPRVSSALADEAERIR